MSPQKSAALAVLTEELKALLHANKLYFERLNKDQAATLEYNYRLRRIEEIIAALANVNAQLLG